MLVPAVGQGANAAPLQTFVDQLSRRRGLLRVPGTAVFLSRGNKTAPLAMRANVEHNHVLHERVVIVTVDTLQIPRAGASERAEVDPLGPAHDHERVSRPE